MTQKHQPSWRYEIDARKGNKEKRETITPTQENGFPFSRFHGQEPVVKTSLQRLLDDGIFARALREAEHGR